VDDSFVSLVTNCRAYAGPGSVAGLVAAGHKVFCHDPSFVDVRERTLWGSTIEPALALAAQEPEGIVEEVLAQAGRIDAVISNDAVHPDGIDFTASSDDFYRQRLEEGAVWPYRIAKAVLPPMIERKAGALVFITSATARDPQPGAPLYSAVRAATTALATSLGRKYGKSGIAVNAIGPSWFENPSYFPPGWEEASPDRAEQLRRYGTLDRLGTQEEMGRLVAFLAERRAMPVTAQYIDFAGSSPA
jgi:NAD(P)-dependent dehydrogenase (short-subunit alcohol dehydrogenase family)